MSGDSYPECLTHEQMQVQAANLAGMAETASPCPSCQFKVLILAAIGIALSRGFGFVEMATTVTQFWRMAAAPAQPGETKH